MLLGVVCLGASAYTGGFVYIRGIGRCWGTLCVSEGSACSWASACAEASVCVWGMCVFGKPCGFGRGLHVLWTACVLGTYVCGC